MATPSYIYTPIQLSLPSLCPGFVEAKLKHTSDEQIGLYVYSYILFGVARLRLMVNFMFLSQDFMFKYNTFSNNYKKVKIWSVCKIV